MNNTTLNIDDLTTKELEIEAKYHKLGSEAMLQIITNAKLDKQVTDTKLGLCFTTHVFKPVAANMEKYIAKQLAPKCGAKSVCVDLLKTLAGTFKDPKTFTNLVTFATITTLIDYISSSQANISKVSNKVGEVIINEANLQKFINENADLTKLIDTGIDKRVGEFYRRSYAKSWYKNRDEEEKAKIRDKYNREPKDFTPIAASGTELSALGTSLIDVVVTSCNYFEYCTKDTLLSIRPTDVFMEAFTKNTDKFVANAYKTCPMIIEPKPWVSQVDGGYIGELQTVSTFLRLHGNQGSVYAKNYKQRLKQVEIEKVTKAINAIQNTPWKINTHVLEVLQALVERGGNVAGIPSINPPPKPVVLPEKPTEEQIKHYREVMADYYRDETTRKSIVLRALSNIRMAEDFKTYPKIYFPCNCDFRGRVYPIPTFSFQGDDLTKSLLLFADVPPVKDQKAIDWLMVHGANLAGVDKVSFADRLQWVKENEAQILASAADPLGNLWWADQDSPCQMLAWCFEWERLQAYLKEHNGDPAGFMCGIPVAFDGTCSGLQHFSAILRDPIGGAAVNLVPTDKPSDIYAIVAAKVNVVLEADAKNGTPDEWDTKNNRMKYGTKTTAQTWLTFGVTRKVTKRSVMTLAYGSKQYGFKQQLLDDIIKPDMRKQKEGSCFTKSNNFQCAAYLAKLIWEAVQTTVVKAVEGMKWLQDCAAKVTKGGQVVTWTTPAGLPVQQAYMAHENVCVKMRVAGKRIRIYNNEVTGDIDKRSQTQGIAPNFIHSMDAAHLQLTIDAAVDKGLKHFAVIHDSYGASVADADTMFNTVRETFVDMYTKNDVLQTLREELSHLTDEKLPEPPKRGTLDIQCVLKSPYIFC